MDELFMCRQIMRVYTCFNFDCSTLRLKPGICPDVTAEYYSKERELMQMFSDAGVEMTASGICSSFNSEIKIVPQIFFVYKLKYYIIPRRIINKLRRFLISKGITPNLPECKTKLYFGYTGRSWDRVTNCKFVTDGIQRDVTNDIVMDFALYEHAPYDTFLHRLIHELLHTLGVEEEQMDSIICDACIYMRKTAEKFILQLQQECSLMFDDFKKRLFNMQLSNNQTVEFLYRLGMNLYEQKGYYELPYSIDVCKAFYPISFSPLELREFNILFM